MAEETKDSEREVSPSRGSGLLSANCPGASVSNQKPGLAEREDLNSQQEDWEKLGKISGCL